MIHIVTRNFLFWLAVVFLHLVIAKPAFAQMVGASSYTDSWGDDYNVYGSGTTDSPYNNYNHTFRAVTTIVSPSGRSSSQDTGYSSYATAHVSLSFDENDLGLYSVDTDHYDYCPIVSQEVFSGHTSAAVKTGLTILCYDYYGLDTTTDRCLFQIQNDCPVTKCKSTNLSYSRPRAEGYGCPSKVAVKFRWTEKQSDCICLITCIKTSDVPLYDNPDVCICVQTVPI